MSASDCLGCQVARLRYSNAIIRAGEDETSIARLRASTSPKCENHVALAEAAARNALLKAQARAEQSNDLVRELARNRRLQPEVIHPALTVRSVFPMGVVSAKAHAETPLADGLVEKPLIPTAEKDPRTLPTGGFMGRGVGAGAFDGPSEPGADPTRNMSVLRDPSCLDRPGTYIPRGKRKARLAIP